MPQLEELVAELEKEGKKPAGEEDKQKVVEICSQMNDILMEEGTEVPDSVLLSLGQEMRLILLTLFTNIMIISKAETAKVNEILDKIDDIFDTYHMTPMPPNEPLPAM